METRIIKMVGAKWRELGSALGFEPEDLDTIDANSLKDVGNANIALFGKWQRTSEDRSWSRLISALEDADFGVLAKDVTAALEFIYK